MKQKAMHSAADRVTVNDGIDLHLMDDGDDLSDVHVCPRGWVRP